jgi:hypothetical protein
MRKYINTLEPFLKVYPSDDQVFAEPVARYARHIFPLVSIDLSAVNPSWDGWVHLVNTVEPEDEIVGKATHPFHNYYLRENWVAFHLNEEGRYELLGDFRYFYLENLPGTLPEAYGGHRQELEEHYARQHAAFMEARARLAEHSVLPSTLLTQLGGGVSNGEWTYGSPPFPLDESDENNVRPLTPDGTPFHFIASTSAYDYCDWGADVIYLFFEPVSRTALLTFGWS